MTNQLGEKYIPKRKLSDDSARDLKKIEDWIKKNKHSKEEVEEPITKLDEEKPKISISSKDLTFITDENLYKEIVCYMDKTFHYTSAFSIGKLYFDGVMKGSNPYIATAVDMFLQSINDTHRIATQKDLETNLEMFKGFYEDTGLVLRSLKDPNQDKANYLYGQIAKANSTLPIFFNLRGLKLDANLNFNLTEESRYKTANCLNWEKVARYSKIDEFGLPTEKDINSLREIWTLKDGFVRLSLNKHLDLNSYNGGLEDSNDNGRVVLVDLKKGELK
ncbi:MAG TPA: hypothetical protein HA283_00465 [Nanoarchaeota archaeon]|nr:hypothetical protein [Nanoarchaeota archaeon]HIH62746.1 hypothetical protein [Nanoarchaeota archaeon]HIJ10012.1 hypothetical protein [Nanoarchaeota archaeon]